MPCRNVGMIVTCLRALAIVGERINIDEELGGEIVKDRIGDVDVGLQTEAGMPHKRDLRCQTEAVGRAIAATDQFEILGQSIELAEPMSKYAAKEDYVSKKGKVVGGTGKFFVPIGDGKHEGVYQRVVIKRIGHAS